MPSREMVLKELWGTKKITVARVKALGLLLAELKETPAIAATNHGSPVVALPAWMQDDEKAAE